MDTEYVKRIVIAAPALEREQAQKQSAPPRSDDERSYGSDEAGGRVIAT
jgi:hypothetical protein